jgi:hypothetical protein
MKNDNKLSPRIFHDIDLFEDVLAGVPVAELVVKYGMTKAHVYNTLRRFVRRLYHHFRETRPELDFTRYRTQSSPREFLKDKGDWAHFINLYKKALSWSSDRRIITNNRKEICMPVSAIEAIATMQSASDWSQKAIVYIDEHLNDARWMRNNVTGIDTNPTFTFTVEGLATKGDKELVIEAYTKAGWGEVIVRNSAENGERPGIVGIVLSQRKPQGENPLPGKA